MIRDIRAGRFAAACVLTFVSFGVSPFAAAQSPANGGGTPSPQSAADKKPDKPADTSAEPAAAAQVKKHKVITNDDINIDRARHNDGFAGGAGDTHAIAGTGVCDDECADQAREMAGFGPEQDGEWRFALASARRSLAADAAWPGAYATLARAMKTYRTFQTQLQATAVPSGNDYGSRVERAKRQQYVNDMSRVLSQSVNNANAQIDRMAQQADENEEPARGAIMRVLAHRVNESCDP